MAILLKLLEDSSNCVLCILLRSLFFANQLHVHVHICSYYYIINMPSYSRPCSCMLQVCKLSQYVASCVLSQQYSIE